MKNRVLFFLVLFIVTQTQAQTPTLWGMTSSGGPGNGGTIFKINSTGSSFSDEYSFYHSLAANPFDNVIQATNGLLYGMTYGGGPNNYGAIFSYNTTTGLETDLYYFGSSDTDGQNPNGSFIQVGDSLLYAVTTGGGSNGWGTIFSYNIFTGAEKVEYSFNYTDGGYPSGSLILANNGLLYGVTLPGGSSYDGSLFSFNTSTKTDTVLHFFEDDNKNDGSQPSGALLQANDSLLYGMTTMGGAYGGSYGYGTIFSYNISKSVTTILYSFTGGDDGNYPVGSLIHATNGLFYAMNEYGIFSFNSLTDSVIMINKFSADTNSGFNPQGSLIQASNGLLYGLNSVGGLYSYNSYTYGGTLFSFNIQNGSLTVIHNFNTPYSDDGMNPSGSLFQAKNGLLYGLASGGGWQEDGVIFSCNILSNSETTLFSFGTSPFGYGPTGSLFEANNGLLYGMAPNGGVYVTAYYGSGDIFSYNEADSEEMNLYLFAGQNDGYYPGGSLIQGTDGLLYGTTAGSWSSQGNQGAIFNYDISTGKETVLHYFSFNNNDGNGPSGALLQVGDSLLYGLTGAGGDNNTIDGGDGTIFSYNIYTHKEIILHNFGSGGDGSEPVGSLINAGEGLLYGMTRVGNSTNNGTIFSYNISTGVLTDLHDFGSGTDGNYPTGSLIQANNGLLYGMTVSGGSDSVGVIFSYDMSTGDEVVLYNFGSDSDGRYPWGSLIQASDGRLYGMTELGGANDTGMIFSYNISTGIETDIHDFTGFDGGMPFGDLLEVDSTTGINQLSVTNNQLSIYPNPTSGQFTIKTNGNQNGYTVEIYNLLGEEVYVTPKSPKGDFQKQAIDLSSQPAGLYFVYLKSDDGVEVGKVMVTK
jgi:uncharacterized repeat protein (TIGR03803 family)